MIGAIVFFLLGAGSIGLSFYLKTVLVFGGVADRILFWVPIVLGVILLIAGIDRLEREYGFLGALLDRRDAKKAKAKKTEKTAEPAPTKEKTAKRAAKNPAWSFKTSGALGSVGRMIGFSVAHVALITVAWYLLTMFRETGKLDSTLHWVPITVAAIFYFASFIVGYSLNTDSFVFKKILVVGHTRKEVCDQIGKALSATGYAYYHVRVVRLFVPIFIAEAAVATLLTPFALNFLVATPMILLISLIHHKPEGVGDVVSDLITKAAGDNWRKHLCPKCGAILGKFHIADSREMTGEQRSLGSETYTVTDKYTNGYDTLYVDRTEKEYYVHTQTSYKTQYSCPRCKHRWTKNEYSSSREYI